MQESRSLEAAIGLEVYLSDAPGIGGRLKRSPEDFLVEEVSTYPPRVEGGQITIARVTAQNWEMNRLVRQLSRALGISRERIGFAGTKDKRAITSQLMSFPVPAEQLLELDLHQITISDPYPAKKGITIGDLIGNAFVIKVTETSLRGQELKEAIETTSAQLREMKGFPNYFGVQRFGAVRPITHEVGKWIVKGDLERAVMTYVANPVPRENEDTRAARQRLAESGDFEEALGYYPRKMTFERTMIGHLARHPGDFAGAISAMPSNLQMMFVHAYQSFIFNRILSERIRRGIPIHLPIEGDLILPADRQGIPEHGQGVPVSKDNLDLVEKQVRSGRAFVSGVLFGTESELAEGEMGEIERRIIEEEGLQRDDFMVPPLHKCSSKGTRRELLSAVKDLRAKADDDSVTFSFTLNKGCYATTLLREYLKKDELMDY
ncbi:MAG: tRNA pseudouridine(13) synthase TruD [Euryarchaeota archaeon]|nr:tRNA pseudouridine(13) synthase TruD [Euryarchaeota archaeon]